MRIPRRRRALRKAYRLAMRELTRLRKWEQDVLDLLDTEDESILELVGSIDKATPLKVMKRLIEKLRIS